MLIVENLSYTYTDTQVLENIHFTLSQGEVLSIVGASGSGKSTLLKALYGLERNTCLRTFAQSGARLP